MKTTIPNSVLFWAVVVLLGLAPLPLGSNRPFFWAVNGLIVAAFAIAYILMLRGEADRLRVPLRAVGLPAALFAIAVAWMVIQIVPLPEELGRYVRSAQELPLPESAYPGQLSVDPAATIGMIIRYLTYGLLFFLVLQTTYNPARARTLVQAVFWIAVIHGAAAIIMLLELGDTLLFLPKWAYEGFATGFFVNRNSFATFAAFGMAAGTVLALDAYLPRENATTSRAGARPEVARTFLVYAVGLAILATALVLSASRMGAFVAALGIACAFVIAFLRVPERRGGVVVGLVVIVGVAVAVLVTAGGQLSDRVGSLETNLDERLLLYEQVLDMIVARPWTGYGGGAFAAAFPLFHELPLSADVTWDSAHNLYFELVSDLGFAAVFPLLAVLILVARSARALADRRVHWVAPATAVCMTVIAAVHSLVDFSLQIEANVMIFIAVVAAGTAQAELVNRHVPSVNANGGSGAPPGKMALSPTSRNSL